MTDALATLPLPDLANPLRDALILRERLSGATQAAAAATAGCSTRTAERVLAKHRDYVGEAQRRLSRTFLSEADGIVRAQMGIARDPENRQAVSAWRELCEKLTGWGVRGGNTTIQGDVALHMQVDASQHLHVEMSEEERAEYLAFKSKHGLA